MSPSAHKEGEKNIDKMRAKPESCRLRVAGCEWQVADYFATRHSQLATHNSQFSSQLRKQVNVIAIGIDNHGVALPPKGIPGFFVANIAIL